MDLTAILLLVSATTCVTLVHHALARLFSPSSGLSLPKPSLSRRRPASIFSQQATDTGKSPISTSTAVHHRFSLDRTTIFGSRTSHRRMFPRPHAFAYSYLLIGHPVRNEQARTAVQGSHMPWWRRWWVRVDAQDHLHRDPDEHDISKKLDRYLREQDLDPSIFPFVYLVTSPRLLNYKFSPASFWYLYSASNELRYVIAEVNNTFDERRMYLLPQSTESSDQNNNSSSAKTQARPERLKHLWPKDFHVSPFSSRKGAYSLTTVDPALSDGSFVAAAAKETLRPPERAIDITATLLSSKGRPKLIARLWSVDEPLDLLRMSWLEAARLLAGWWWVGPITYPRIVCEAIKLAWTHKLEMWYRPEPNTLTTPRRASASEAHIAQHFISYLRHVLLSSTENFTLHCKLPVYGYELVTMRTSNASESTSTPSFTLTVTTPRFLLQAVGTNKTLHALMATALMDPHPQNRTAEVTIGDSERLVNLLTKAEEIATRSSSSKPAKQPWMSKVLQYVRVKVSTAGVYPEGLPSHREAIAIKTIEPGGLTHSGTSQINESSKRQKTIIDSGKLDPESHFLDEFVWASCDNNQQRQYATKASVALARSAIARITGGE